jgi:arylsulfatase A-like enzyme
MQWPGHIPAGRTTDQVAITMDWMPTLLSAAGVSPAPDYPPDGVDLLPVLTRNAAPMPRKLYWRYKFNSQSAVRDGDMKWLRIGGKTFLFDVVEDPLERANLKDRQPELYKRLMADFEAWNKTMLNDPKAGSVGFTSDQLADHFISER